MKDKKKTTPKTSKASRPQLNKMTVYAEKPVKQVQVSFKQLLEKVTALAKAAGSKAKSILFPVKERWYYFALVIIIFTIVVPYLPAKGLSSAANLLQFRQGNGAVQGPSVTLEDPENTMDIEDPVGLPRDLFNEQEARNMTGEAASQEKDTQNKETDPAAKLVPMEELQKISGRPGEEEEAAEPDEQPADMREAKPQISLSWPVSGKIAHDYGLGYSQAYGDYRFNSGLNLASQENYQVKAAAPGKVTFVGEDLLYNKYIVIEHASGFTTLYGNLSQIAAAVGDRVESGTVVGQVGQPGYHSLGLGTNLFFQVKLAEQPVDPKEYLSK